MGFLVVMKRQKRGIEFSFFRQRRPYFPGVCCLMKIQYGAGQLRMKCQGQFQ